MDDLLIVRMSDHSKARTAREHRHSNPTSIGMNLGLVTGVGLGLSFSQIYASDPMIGLIFGLAIGLALGGLFGKFITPRRREKPVIKHYQGLFPKNEEEPETPSTPTQTSSPPDNGPTPTHPHE